MSAPPFDGREPTAREVEIAKKILEASGHVVLKAKAYHQAQQRQRAAEAKAEYADKMNLGTQRWAQEELGAEIRSLRDRVTFLYGAARAAGCTVEDLRGNAS